MNYHEMVKQFMEWYTKTTQDEITFSDAVLLHEFAEWLKEHAKAK